MEYDYGHRPLNFKREKYICIENNGNILNKNTICFISPFALSYFFQTLKKTFFLAFWYYQSLQECSLH